MYLQALMKADTIFLSSKGLMDYSLYLTIEEIKKIPRLSINESTHKISRNFILSDSHDKIYHLGIIDYL